MQTAELFHAIRNARRSRPLFGHRVLFTSKSNILETDLDLLEANGGYRFPRDVRSALIVLGACSIDAIYLHAPRDISAFDAKNGQIAGFVAFASDDSGNFFAFDPKAERPDTIYYCSHDPLGYAVVSGSFSAFLGSLVESGFVADSLTDKLDLLEL